MDPDETNKHLSLQTLAAYINMSEQMSDREKQSISDHLAKCKKCSEAFNRIFDEVLELEGNEHLISLIRQPETSDEETAVFTSTDTLLEIELTRLGKSDFNLRFLALPTYLKNQKAALKSDSGYILRVLSLDTETIYIIHTEDDIMNLGLLELASPASPPLVSNLHKTQKQQGGLKIYRIAAVIIILFAAVLFIYYITRPKIEIQQGSNQPQVITDLTPGQKPINESDTASVKKPPPVGQDSVKIQKPSEITDDFTGNNVLDSLIDKYSGPDQKVEVISPSAGAEVKMPVRFEWMTAQKNIILRFVILTNREVPVYERLISGKEITIDRKLNPGLYYWKLESSGNIEAVGKFFIR